MAYVDLMTTAYGQRKFHSTIYLVATNRSDDLGKVMTLNLLLVQGKGIELHNWIS